ncbi:MAG: DUF3592 domain-containing protein [Pseudomonadota bacterium]
MNGDSAESGLWLLFLILGLFPWILTGLGLWLVWTAWQFSQRALSVTARVVALNEERIPPRRPSGKETVLRRPVFEYVAPDGSALRAEAFAPSPGYKLVVGARARIWVDPDLPEIARINSMAIYAPGLLLIGFGLITGVGVWLLGS